MDVKLFWQEKSRHSELNIQKLRTSCKFKNSDGHNFKGKGNKNHFDFNTEIYFDIQECKQQISRGNIEDKSANITLIATKLKKRNKLCNKQTNKQLPVRWSIVQERNQDPITIDSDNAQKIKQAEQRSIRKGE